MTRKKTVVDPVGADQPIAEGGRSAELRLMLQQGARWQSNGQFYQALDVYTQLMRDYRDSDVAREAKAHVLEIARGFEGQAKYHQALALYRQVAEYESAPAEDAQTTRAARRAAVMAALLKPAAEAEKKPSPTGSPPSGGKA